MKEENEFDVFFYENLRAIPCFDDLIELWIDYPCLSYEYNDDNEVIDV